MLPCRGSESILRRLFEPLGYVVEAINHILDPQFPAWGDSPYFTVTLRRSCPLKEFLLHLYVLIPVLDNEKHYWIGADEVDKLLKFGEGWLEAHPEKELITHRYLKKLKSLVNDALAQLADDGLKLQEEVIELQEEAIEKTINLNQTRLDWVVAELKSHNAKKIIDLGCGEGNLLKQLLKDNYFACISGCDVSSRSLAYAREKLGLEKLPSAQQQRINLFQTALTYRDKRLAGFDAVTLTEVIEHLDLPRLEALQRVVFEFAKPKLVLITTPNAEYNVLFEKLTKGSFRHHDHRFEWTRQEFQDWANSIAERFNYQVEFAGIGDNHVQFGSPTQGGVFIRND